MPNPVTADIQGQNKIFSELVGRALCQRDFLEAFLKAPSEIAGLAGLSKEFMNTLIKALEKVKKLWDEGGSIPIKEMPDLFGANRSGVVGSMA